MGKRKMEKAAEKTHSLLGRISKAQKRLAVAHLPNLLQLSVWRSVVEDRKFESAECVICSGGRIFGGIGI